MAQGAEGILPEQWGEVLRLVGSGFSDRQRSRLRIVGSGGGAMPLQPPRMAGIQWPGSAGPLSSAMGFTGMGPMPFTFPFGAHVVLGGTGGGGLGATGYVTLTEGLGVNVPSSGVPQALPASFTVEADISAGTGISLAAVGTTLQVTNSAPHQDPTAGTDISVTGTEVNADPEMVWTTFMVNATVNTTTGVITTGVAPTGPDDYDAYTYSCVPVKVTAVAGAVSTWGYVWNDGDDRFDVGVGAAQALSVRNWPDKGNDVDWTTPGVDTDGPAYPAGFERMALGQVRTGGYRSFWMPGFRYTVAPSTYLYGVAGFLAHDGTCTTPVTLDGGVWS